MATRQLGAAPRSMAASPPRAVAMVASTTPRHGAIDTDSPPDSHFITVAGGRPRLSALRRAPEIDGADQPA